MSISVQAQQEEDTTAGKLLNEIIIRAYEQNRAAITVPAAVGMVSRRTLGIFSPASIVPAVNTVPGVRMEERSPGSYRFNIRGSSLRSPFGVRNIKVYFNDIPITDPGGQTYLNQLGYYNFNSIEIIKGPGSSLYGAGTGGVLLIESLTDNEKAGVQSEYTSGSYRLQNIYAGVTTGSQKLVSRMGFQHQQNEGYRNHSELRRDVHSWTGLFRLNEHKLLKVSYLFGDLFYETPGALTKKEYDENPGSARPAASGFPGAEQARASIRQRTFLAGVSYQQRFARGWDNKTVLYGMFTDLRNAAIRNYGKSSEPHAGGRTIFRYQHSIQRSTLAWIAGGEWQEGFASVAIHKNVSGNPDSLQTYDEIRNRQQFLFTQATFDLLNSWSLIAGASWNALKIRFERFMPASLGLQRRKFNNEIAPRAAIMKRWQFRQQRISLYTSVSKGFSPPSTTELVPTGGAINLGLNAEEGRNYEIGIKNRLWQKLDIDATVFWFALKNTVVQRRDAGGGDFFINAGRTKQKGIETAISYPLTLNNFDAPGLFWISHTWNRFRYRDFRQLNMDFSGNAVPGNPKHTVSSGVQVTNKNGFELALNYYYCSKIPVNDANSSFGNNYHLVGARMGWQKWLKTNTWRVRLTAGAENLLDQKYSLGNDLNGFGGRYYNAAPGRNYFVSVWIQWVSKKLLS